MKHGLMHTVICSAQKPQISPPKDHKP